MLMIEHKHIAHFQLYLAQVHKEYDTLVLLHDNKKKVPKPIHCSTPEEEDAVGTQFIIMSYVEVSIMHISLNAYMFTSSINPWPPHHPGIY